MGEGIKTRRGESVGDLVLYLYDTGNENTPFTGGISTKNVQGTGIATTKNATNISFASSVATGYKLGSAYTTNKIDLTNYSKVKMLVDSITGTYPTNLASVVSISASVPTASDFDGYLNAMTAKTRVDNVLTSYIVELDISSVSGEYYVFMNEGNSATLSNSVNAIVSKLWLE